MTVLNALGLDGRLGLKPYLQVALSLLAAKLAIMLIVTRMMVGPALSGGGDPQIAKLILAGVDLLLLWPFIVLNVRRAHDCGRNGVWEAVGVTYATACWVVPDAWAATALPGWLAPFLDDAVGASALCVTLVLQLDSRKLGDNRYGPATGGQTHAAA